MAKRTNTRRAADAARHSSPTALACPACRGTLHVEGEALACPSGHSFPELEGAFDLWPPGTPEPIFDYFSGPYGAVYDAGIKSRTAARVAARALWGADAGEMYRLMDEGVKCGPGEVVLDVPSGGAPGLRAAAGRMLGTYIGIDASTSMLARAASIRREEQLDGVVLARGDAANLPVADSSVDRVLCFNGLHVLPDKAAVLGEFLRVLKPGGQVWGTAVVRQPGLLPALIRPWANTQFLFFHPADAAELRRAAREAGFTGWTQRLSGSIAIFRGDKGRA